MWSLETIGVFIMQKIRVSITVNIFSEFHGKAEDMKTVAPALRQTVTAISTTNTPCTIFKWDSFNFKVHVVYKVLSLVLGIISLLDQQKITFTFTASRSGGDSFHVRCV